MFSLLSTLPSENPGSQGQEELGSPIGGEQWQETQGEVAAGWGSLAEDPKMARMAEV